MAQTNGEYETWPLNAPGMPFPGPDFINAAAAEGEERNYQHKKTKKTENVIFKPGKILKTLYRRALREPGFTLQVEINKGYKDQAVFIPVHIWGQHAAQWLQRQVNRKIFVPPVDGPHPAEVMIIGKMPWNEEELQERNLAGPSGELLATLIRKAHIRDALSWYVTNLVKFRPPDGSSRLKANWISDCRLLLAQELRLVRPKFILCLGADASKELLGKKFNVSYMDGRGR